ncbi:MAG: endonuclease, partial [Myxococcota bacterium]
YNGAVGATYACPLVLSGTIPDEGNGYGAVWFGVPQDGLQNGDPDGLAFVTTGGVVLEFISYEGTFTATNGPAMGMTSVDIGVREQSSTTVGQSLQREGTGSRAEDFTWATPAPASPGLLNPNQTVPF